MHYYHANQIYSVAALTDSTGAAVERYTYDPYGKVQILAADGVTVRASSAVGNPWTWQARRLDQETGLMYFRQRMYSNDLGRFISRYTKKPLLDHSWYQFQFAQPTRYVDPMGDPFEFEGERWIKEKMMEILAEIKEKASEKLKEIENDETACKITLVFNSNMVVIGDFDLSAIDLGDIGELPKEGGAGTYHAAIVHELMEQWEKQKGGKAYEVAHKVGYSWEEHISGNRRLGETGFKLQADGTLKGEFAYQAVIVRDGKTEVETAITTQTIRVKSGNIQHVREVKEENPLLDKNKLKK